MKNNLKYFLGGLVTSVGIIVVIYMVLNIDIDKYEAPLPYMNIGTNKTANGLNSKEIEKIRKMKDERMSTIHKMLFSRDPAVGVALCDKIIKQEKYNTEVRASLAEYYIIHQQYGKARHLLDDALTVEPEYSFGLRTMGFLMFQENDLKKAEGYFLKTTEGNSKIDTAWAYVWLARVYSKTEEKNKMRESVEKALAYAKGDIYVKRAVKGLVK